MVNLSFASRAFLVKVSRPVHVILTVLMVSGIALGQVTGNPSPGEADHALLDKLRVEGSEALFNLDYEGARLKFLEIKRRFPDHPAGPLLLATALWLRKLNESRRLQATLYNSSSFYAKNEDQVDPNIVEQFRQLTKAAKQLAEARLKRNPQDTEALYFLGSTEGLKAAFEGAVERRFIAALRDGSSSVEHHREVLKLNPDFHDAELTIGLYEYVLGSLPLPLKLMMSITGAHGSKKRGIETLERVAKEGRFSCDNAKVFLIAIDKREKQWADALRLSRELEMKYPRNYLFKLETADALVSQATTERQASHTLTATSSEREAFGIFDSLLQDRRLSASFDLIHFRYGEALLAANQPERAAKEFLAAANSTNAEPGLVTMSHLRAGQSLDITGQRSEAISQYQAVLRRPNIYDAYDEARRGLREPYSQGAQKIR